MDSKNTGHWQANERTVSSNTKPESRICRPGKPRRELLLQSFFLIIPFYFSLILVVYLLGEVDVITPILLIFSFAPYLPLFL